MNAIQKYYKWLCNIPSSINQHLPTLRAYAENCNNITEFGFRHGHSTTAFLSAKPKRVVTYDVDPICCHTWEWLNAIIDGSVDFIFLNKNTLKAIIEPTDLLFIDSWHVHDQLRTELRQADNVRKYIILHDTELFGEKGENGGEGLNKAIEEFLQNKREWQLSEHFTNCSGLTILKRR